MKLTIMQLLESQAALSELAQDKRLPAKTSYWCAKLLRKADGELKDYHSARLGLCQSLGTENETKTAFLFPDEGSKVEFQKQYAELVATEIELPGEPFTLEGLGAATISAASMMALEWLIVE